MSSEKTKFSVLMSVYKNDKLEFVKQAIDSIINQTLKPNEIIIVIDGPVPDEIKELLLEYETTYEYLKLVELEKNVGLGNALNIGLEKCSYNLVARMDSDDISIQDRFEKQIEEFKKESSLSVVGGWINEFIDNPQEIISTRKVPTDESEISKYIRKRNPFNHMTVMFKKDDVLEVGSYKDFFLYEDYYLWVRMFLKNKRFRNIGDVLVNARGGKDMHKRRGGWKYYKTGVKFQNFLLKNKLIGLHTYIFNIVIRFIVQVLCPNSIRSRIYKKIIRK